MYSDVFCKVYNEFGWNYYPEAFGVHLLLWMQEKQFHPKSSLDLACGTGILCQILHKLGLDVWGMDFSEGMIAIARENNPSIHYDVADMILYRPDKTFDLVTCTGDALNHILNLSDVEKIFRNVYAYLNPGGYFIFDILNETEVSPCEPFDVDFSETVRARFQITREDSGIIQLRTKVFENNAFQFEEVITEIIHDPDAICALLRNCGFTVERLDNQLTALADHRSTTWYVIARK
ncbi:MAG: class I SAM-dependent methyltransferase [Oscillospiraceae bacterium]|nr:class I SAM-dependent methyltransferase [Oscillospiraceae bacterium]